MKLPKNRAPSHPGEVLKEIYLVDLQISQSELARKMGCRVQKINEIINGKRCVTPEFAVELGEVLKTGPELWVNLQSAFDLWHAIQAKKSA